MNSVVIIGYGAVGRYVANALERDPHHTVAAIVCRPGREAHVRATANPAVKVVSTIGDLGKKPGCVVDCAGHGGLRAHGAEVLERGWSLATVSVGALADQSLYDALKNAALRGSSQLHLVSGAVGALDALSSAREGGLTDVLYRGRKPPAGWAGSAAENTLDLDALDSAAVHFRGTAREAALGYPKNANVAATVALAGLGFEQTRVELVADPALTQNLHEIEATGAFGQLRFEIAGHALPDAPRSSALTAMSVVRHIRSATASIRL